MLEAREYTDNKEATFQGVEFLLTGFPNQKEKEIESLIRKSGGYVLSKVPPFPLDKRKNMAEFPRWKPPIVLSPKKVCYFISFQCFGQSIRYLVSFIITCRNHESQLKIVNLYLYCIVLMIPDFCCIRCQQLSSYMAVLSMPGY